MGRYRPYPKWASQTRCCVWGSADLLLVAKSGDKTWVCELMMSQHWETGPTHFELCLHPDKFLKQGALNSKGSGRSLISPGGSFMSPGTVISALSPPRDSTFGQSHTTPSLKCRWVTPWCLSWDQHGLEAKHLVLGRASPSVGLSLPTWVRTRGWQNQGSSDTTWYCKGDLGLHKLSFSTSEP